MAKARTAVPRTASTESAQAPLTAEPPRWDVVVVVMLESESELSEVLVMLSGIDVEVMVLVVLELVVVVELVVELLVVELLVVELVEVDVEVLVMLVSLEASANIRPRLTLSHEMS